MGVARIRVDDKQDGNGGSARDVFHTETPMIGVESVWSKGIAGEEKKVIDRGLEIHLFGQRYGPQSLRDGMFRRVERGR